jgi:hypothetical protein
MKRETTARMASTGGWGEVGRDSQARYARPDPQMRRRCWMCARGDHKATATHYGYVNGVALTYGCEFHMTQWARGS